MTENIRHFLHDVRMFFFLNRFYIALTIHTCVERKIIDLKFCSTISRVLLFFLRETKCHFLTLSSNENLITAYSPNKIIPTKKEFT